MRIAIVNDLALAQAVLRRLVESVPGYVVAWTAADGAEAVRRAAADRPDVILMDLIMPVMDGAEATRRIMAASPCPILVVTASVGGNFGKVYEALGAGGLDAVKTPTVGPGGHLDGGGAILERLAKLERASAAGLPSPGFAGERTGVSGAQTVTPVPSPAKPGEGGKTPSLPPFLAIGASTGGPEAVAQVLAALAPPPPGPVAVVQHIAADFASGFTTWLQSRTRLPVQLIQNGITPAAGQVYVVGSDDHVVLRADRRFAHTPEPRAYPYRPSVDVFFESLAVAWPRPGVAVLLTGMGSDGASGLARLKDLGWHTIAQDQATSVVYGMPRAAAERNAACQVLPLSQIGPSVLARLNSLARAGSPSTPPSRP
ncbi:MAG TPA: chemotaxis-specific protein-glutamate methyltransferase CheB [Gemmataceae bacterium]|nr:chemotaxis-specific protein-glutamate methyltransferase CheB [Gemmataceae bacterium]